ncbi:MAG: DUF4402 domain-containing protein [Sphingomonadales bacterium]|jgi:hypothetical protein|nr:DUF4402 domain-containing protein [Sphingomonadales bacterium]
MLTRFQSILASLGALLLALAGMAAPAHAAGGAGPITTIVVKPLSFFPVDDLNFGSLLAGATAGTVTIAPDGTRTSTGGAAPIGGGFTPARFAGMGTYNQIVNISMAATPITITRQTGTQTMQVRTFTIGSSPTTQVLTTTPRSFRIGSASGIFLFSLGAQLVVGANQMPGTYTGTYTVVLNYM